MLSRKILIILLVIASILTTVLTFAWRYYLATTQEISAPGGTYTEGLIGQPQYFNPVFALSDVDQDVTSLVFSGLMRVNEKGELVPDLAESFTISENGKVYDFYLRKNISWHDGQLFTSDDVYFTFQLLKNPDTNSPLKANYENVEVTKETTHHVRFTLPSPYAFFLHTMTIGILPYHHLRDIPPNDLLNHRFNLAPIGTGPFQVKKLLPREEHNGEVLEYHSVILEQNPSYYFQKPYLENVVFVFYSPPFQHEKLVKAYRRGEIDGISTVANEVRDSLKHTNIKLNYLRIPEMKSVFFNLRSKSPLRQEIIRAILDKAIDKRDLLDETTQIGYLITGPLLDPLPEEQEGASAAQSLGTIQAILEEQGWKENENGIREKDGEQLAFKLITDEESENIAIASRLAATWKKLGCAVTVSSYPQQEFYIEYIEPRNYDAVLLTVNLGSDPDQYPLWHSSQIEKRISFNFSNISDVDLDTALEDARRLFRDPNDPENTRLREREKLYNEFQENLLNKHPALFLYSPYYVYGVSREVRGIKAEVITKPSDRFASITTWAVKTERVPK